MMWNMFQEKSKPGSEVIENLAYESQLELEIKTKQKYLQALQEQTLDYIHHLDTVVYFPAEILRGSWYYLSGEKERIKDNQKVKDLSEQARELRKTQKNSFDFLTDSIKKHLVPKDSNVVITDIIAEGLCTYAYKINADITINGITKNVNFRIPVLRNIDQENRVYALEGRYRLGYDNDCCDEFLAASYDMKEIADAVWEYIIGYKVVEL